MDDGSNTYLYGLERIAQQNAGGSEYFLTDALGSVRQRVDAAGTIIETQSFDPYGNLFSSSGTLTSYGFAGEWTDETGLEYLRARYYSPDQGRFLNKDPFSGSLTQPASQMPYLYALNNPILYTDPSGQDVGCSAADPACLSRNAVEWNGHGLSLETRFDIDIISNHICSQSWRVALAYSLYAKAPHFKLLAIRDWAFSRIMKDSDRGQALNDFMLAEAAIIANGLMAASMGGDINPIGSGNAYTVAYETILPEGSFPGTTRNYHFRLANQALLEDMRSDPEFAQGMNELIPNLTEQISSNSGKIQSPANWTWHHNPSEPGLMQLVPRIQHESPLLRRLFLDQNGNGGYANWGK